MRGSQRSVGLDDADFVRRGRPDPMTRPGVIRSDALANAGENVSHSFFTRVGGHSTGLYSGLNAGLGSGDDRGKVLENRKSAVSALGADGAPLSTPHQVHSSDVATLAEPWDEDRRPLADAVVTNRPGLAIGVLTADCGPVLLADGEAGVVGAAHAGWKGALGGILENTINAMEELSASRARIRATLGPTISQANYEVGPEFIERFLNESPENHVFFTPSQRPGHALFDLPGYIVGRLTEAGVSASWTGDCTYADDTRFYSYRRATHRGEPDYGRLLSAIIIRK